MSYSKYLVSPSLISSIASTIRTKLGTNVSYKLDAMPMAIEEIGGADVENEYIANTLSSYTNSTATTVGSFAFYRSTKLQTAVFTKATNLSTSAFAYCASLTSASFAKCNTIGDYVFKGCSSLTSLYLMSTTVATYGTDVFASTPMLDSTLTGAFGSIYVKSSLVTAYKAAAGWSSISARIVGV